MKFLSIVATAFLFAVPASAEINSEVTWELKTLKDGRARLWAHVRFRGFEPGEKFGYSFHWTAPAVFYEHKDGSRTRLFSDSTYTPKDENGDPKTAGDGSCPCRPLCADTNERDCWRTRSYRTVDTFLGDESKRRASGTWKLRITRDDTGETIGEAEFNVE